MRSTLIGLATLLAVAPAVRAQEAIDSAVAAAPEGVVEIRNVTGSVVIEGWDQPTVHVTGTLGTGRFELLGNRRSTRVLVHMPNRVRNAEPTHLHVRVPAGSTLDVHTTSARIEARGVTGPVELNSVSGRIEVSGSPRSVTVNSTSGRVAVEAVGVDPIRVRTVSGSIQIAGGSGMVVAQSTSGTIRLDGSPANARLRTISGSIHASRIRETIEATTTSGRIEVDGDAPRDLRLKSLSGPIRYSGTLHPAGTFSVESTSGGIRLELPADIAADFRVNTMSGAIRSALTETTARGARDLRFSVGGGGATVTVRTMSGSIDLVRR